MMYVFDSKSLVFLHRAKLSLGQYWLEETAGKWQMLPADVSEIVCCHFHCEHLRRQSKCSWLHNDLQ